MTSKKPLSALRIILCFIFLYALVSFELQAQRGGCERTKKTKFYFIISVPGVGVNYNTNMFTITGMPANVRTVPVLTEYAAEAPDPEIRDSACVFKPVNALFRGSVVLGLRHLESHFKLGGYYNFDLNMFPRMGHVNAKYDVQKYDVSSYYSVATLYGYNYGGFFRFIFYQDVPFFIEYAYDIQHLILDNGYDNNGKLKKNESFELGNITQHIVKVGYEQVGLLKNDYQFEISVTGQEYVGLVIPGSEKFGSDFSNMQMDRNVSFVAGLTFNLYFLIR